MWEHALGELRFGLEVCRYVRKAVEATEDLRATSTQAYASVPPRREVRSSHDYPPTVPEAVKTAASDVAEAVQDNFAAVIRRNPLQAVAIAAGVGFVLALIVR